LTRYYYLHNKQYLALFFSSPRTIKQQRQSTFALEIRSLARITLSFDQLSINQSLKFVFNSNRETCDVLLHNKSSRDNISRKHFRITINIDTRVLIVNDKFIYSTIIIFRQFGERILRKASTSIFAYNNI